MCLQTLHGDPVTHKNPLGQLCCSQTHKSISTDHFGGSTARVGQPCHCHGWGSAKVTMSHHSI